MQASGRHDRLQPLRDRQAPLCGYREPSCNVALQSCAELGSRPCVANFYASNFEAAGASIGPEGDVDVFHLPGPSDQPDITLTGGIYATAFDDRPAVMALMAYLVSAEFADTRARLTEGDFLSPNRNVDTSVYPGRQHTFATILSTAEPVRFDASDLMPGVVGADAFWQAVVNITRGASVAEEFAAVEAVWPDG